MKKVLITGANSYIGTSFETWIKENHDSIETDTQDMIGDAWKTRDFSRYTAVFHVAGIAHADVGNATEQEKQLYYKVNTDLTIACAKKAKAEGVKQFIFMSSIIVYGESAGMGKRRVITKDTLPEPANFYGNSKLKAEEGLLKLADESFKVVILRPPMIYGKGSKGNYPLLAKMAKTLPFFPDVQNERSMLYIGNLCKFISLMIENEENGIFFPQNAEYVRTSDMVREIAEAHGRKIYLTRVFNPMLKLLGNGVDKSNRGNNDGTGCKICSIVNKAFGSLVYEKSMSEYKEMYQVYNYKQSILMTEEVH